MLFRTGFYIIKNTLSLRNNFNALYLGKHGFCSTVLLQETLKLQNTNVNHSILEKRINDLCSQYKTLSKERKTDFLIELSHKYCTDNISISKIASVLTNDNTTDIQSFIRIKKKLQIALTPEYNWLFIHIGRQENGVKFLVDMRTDLLELLKATNLESETKAHLQELNLELKELLMLWFSVGFLKLERITWKSSCDMLQKISEYEAVHPVRSWTDLKQRMGEDRRCFIYTHNSMPDEPLVVLHTALRSEIIDSLNGLTPIPGHNENQPTLDPKMYRAAIFYSISATQKGLQGIELGNYIIKKVASELVKEFPQLKMFSTLSPIPKFKNWFFDKLKFAEKGENLQKVLFTVEEICELKDILGRDDIFVAIRKHMSSNIWLQSPQFIHVIKPILMRLCLKYLYSEKKRGYALCSVANFHLKNGAEMWRLNWLADLTPRGLSSSCGLMVNYRYRLEKTDKNSQNYIQEKQIVTSKYINKLMQELKIFNK